MGDSDVTASRWKSVEVGRIVHFSSGKYRNRIAAIVEIIDNKRVLVDGPAADAKHDVPRHAASLADVSLTSIVIEKLPRGIRRGSLKSKWEEAEVDKNWKEGSSSKSLERNGKRRSLIDFHRHSVMRLKKRVRFQEKRALAKIRASAS